MNRTQALKKIRTAFKQGELGFQNGATKCLYYDKKTDSYCAVGVLIGENESVMNSNGDIDRPFKQCIRGGIESAMSALDKETYCGLNIVELGNLQMLHDNIIGHRYEDTTGREQQFENYLFGLPKKLGGV